MPRGNLHVASLQALHVRASRDRAAVHPHATQVMASKRTERAEEEHVHVGEVLERRVGALTGARMTRGRAAGDIAQTRTVLCCCRHRRHLRHHRRRGGRIGHVARFRRFGGFGVGRAGVRAPGFASARFLRDAKENFLRGGGPHGCGHGGLELVHGGGGGAGIVRGGSTTPRPRGAPWRGRLPEATRARVADRPRACPRRRRRARR